MQKWICGACKKVYEVDRDDPNSPALKEAMRHVMEHAKKNEYASFKAQLDKFLLDLFQISTN